jgi:hypothetical protein
MTALDDARAAKHRELRLAAEQEFWDVWGLDEGEPTLIMLYCTVFAPLKGQPLTPRQQGWVDAAWAVFPRIRNRMQALNAATTVEEVAAIQW